MELFNTNLNWFKGNLHTHTTQSDGRKDPEECIRLYKDAGYDFLAITDHRKLTEGSFSDGFLLLTAAEYDNNEYEYKKAYHITGIGLEGDPCIDQTFSPQQIIDAIRSQKGLAVIAHPAWSFLTSENMMRLENYTAVEIWNTISETHSCRGDSANQLDIMAANGRVPLILAVDDTHFYNRDLFGGYIMVNSRSLSKEDILDNIRKGSFYCSQGPQIKQISVDKKLITVQTSPVKELRFISDLFYSHERVLYSKDGSITQGSYTILPEESWVRVECLNKDGKKAWSQYIIV